MSKNPHGGKARKEAYFVQIENADRTPMFVNVTNQLGKPLAFKKPLATTMMRVLDDSVLFSVLKVHKRVLPKLLEEPLGLQPGPLKRLERRAATITEPLPDSRLVVELGESRYEFDLSRDENGVATLDVAGEGEDVAFELPKPALQITLYLTSPRTKRLIVVGWQGYQNKPGSPETVTRAAALALNHLSGLAEFQLLSGITTVKVPPSPARFQVAAPTRGKDDLVQFAVPVRLWTLEATPVAAGVVKVSVDLDNANPATGRLLFHAEPDAALVEAFDANCRSVLERALTAAYSTYLSDEELSDLACNIALGEVSQGDLIRMRDAAATITGFEINPREFRIYIP